MILFTLYTEGVIRVARNVNPVEAPGVTPIVVGICVVRNCFIVFHCNLALMILHEHFIIRRREYRMYLRICCKEHKYAYSYFKINIEKIKQSTANGPYNTSPDSFVTICIVYGHIAFKYERDLTNHL